MERNHETILIVDDSEINRSILADMLGKGYGVIEAEDGQAAVDVLRARHGEISLVLLDVVMPNLDGFGVLGKMNDEGWIADIPVVVISVDIDPEHIARAYELGVTDFISRPFDTNIVRHRVINTLLLWAKQRKLIEIAAEHLEKLGSGARDQLGKQQAEDMIRELYDKSGTGVSDRTLELLERERTKYRFFASLTGDIQFEYRLQPPLLTMFGGVADMLGLPETVRDPLKDETCLKAMALDDVHALAGMLRSTTPGDPVVEYDYKMQVNGEGRWNRIVARAVWSEDSPPRYVGAVGKSMDVHEFRLRLESLEEMASTDPLTGLLNRAGAKDRIARRMAERPNGKFAVLVMDMDKFKSANDTYGHPFGDEVLKHMADRIRSAIRSGDIAVRIGGDEFMIFLEYKDKLESVVQRIHDEVTGGFYKDFPISVSLGAASSVDMGMDYSKMFDQADKNLYDVKRSGRGHYLV